MEDATHCSEISWEIIISCCALIISIITVYQTKNHNYLSVRPIATILPQDYSKKICVCLQNKGLGPLITKSVKFINIITNEEKGFLIDFMPKLEGEILWKDYTKSPQFTLASIESKTLIEFVPKIENGEEVYDNTFKENRKRIRKALSNIRVEITYSGIYNDKSQVLKFDLSWYGRHF